MPRYDYRCSRGHVTESVQGYGTDAIPCTCGLTATRAPIAAGVGISGMRETPTKERYVHLDRAINAQHEIVREAKRKGVQAPDCLAIAQERIRRGDVQAIE